MSEDDAVVSMTSMKAVIVGWCIVRVNEASYRNQRQAQPAGWWLLCEQPETETDCPQRQLGV